MIWRFPSVITTLWTGFFSLFAIVRASCDECISQETLKEFLIPFLQKNFHTLKDGKMKAVVSITLDDEFVIHDIKVIEGEKGLFIAMPSRKASDGEYRDIAHPINSETRSMIQQIVLQRYEEALANDDAADDSEAF